MVTSITHISYSHQSYATLIVMLSLHLNMTFPYHSDIFLPFGVFFCMILCLIALFVGASVIGHG
jgi:hypothetical protein